MMYFSQIPLGVLLCKHPSFVANQFIFTEKTLFGLQSSFSPVMDYFLLASEAVTRRCSSKYVVLKMSQCHRKILVLESLF